MNRVLRCDPVIAYSDGEGSCAGVGVVIFGNSLGSTQPRPVYLEVPGVLRDLWELHKERSATGKQTDIFEIEAIGHMITLLTWP